MWGLPCEHCEEDLFEKKRKRETLVKEVGWRWASTHLPFSRTHCTPHPRHLLLLLVDTLAASMITKDHRPLRGLSHSIDRSAPDNLIG